MPRKTSTRRNKLPTIAATKASSPVQTSGMQDKTIFLTLPPEVRFMIYGYLMKYTGTIIVFKKYDIAKEVDQTTISLLHVSRTIRHEVQGAFYAYQTFQFRSIPAIDQFLATVGRYHSSLIRKIELGPWLCRQFGVGDDLAQLMDWLPNVEYLTITDARTDEYGDSQWVRFDRSVHSARRDRLSHATTALLSASKTLASGRVFYLNNEKLWFVPKDASSPVDVPVLQEYAVPEVCIEASRQANGEQIRSESFGRSEAVVIGQEHDAGAHVDIRKEKEDSPENDDVSENEVVPENEGDDRGDAEE